MAAGKLSPAKPHLTNPVPLSTTSGFSVIPDAVYALTKHEGEGKAPAKDVCRPRTWLASHEQKQKSSKENSQKEPYIVYFSGPSFFGRKNGPFHSFRVQRHELHSFPRTKAEGG